MVLKQSIIDKFSEQHCLFCGRPATTKDHIPTKNLLEKPYPSNLFTVSCCKKCNQSFSKDEEYLLNIIVEITQNPVLLNKKESGSVFRARLRSPKLRDCITKSLIEGTNGRIYIKPEQNRINRIIEKNALGLYFKKYKLKMPLNKFKCEGFYPYDIVEMRPAEIFMLTFKANFQSKKWTIIQENVFSYIIVRDWRKENKLSMILNIHNTVWCLVSIPYPHYQRKIAKKQAMQLALFN